ncbi:hypothetical protein Bpfe_002299 [Biomphalaria pfeifferi]|uniref:Integrase zinc-binding domain-containing protein n=1 Tax=Biomphalaria pfeifferi TaxID=112525 RepID=A0AAD8C9V9_BIOPF|nr:hypothetical protein Bpfe_002299 [Biomphalaria pfeifferi]
MQPSEGECGRDAAKVTFEESETSSAKISSSAEVNGVIPPCSPNLCDAQSEESAAKSANISSSAEVAGMMCPSLPNVVDTLERSEAKWANISHFTEGAGVDSPSSPIEIGAAITRGIARREKAVVKPLATPPCPPTGISPDVFKTFQQSDPTLIQQREWAGIGRTRESPCGSKKFIHKEGLLYRELIDKEGLRTTQLVVPKDHREEVMRVGHEILFGGHLGSKKTIDRVSAEFYWPGLSADVKRYCASCDMCQRTSPRGRTGKLPLGQMPLIDTPFSRVAVDIVGLNEEIGISSR